MADANSAVTPTTGIAASTAAADAGARATGMTGLLRCLRLNSLRGRLILLVALAMAPMVAMTVATGMRERANAIEAGRENLQRLANLAAANEAKSIDGAMQILRDLSSVPSLMDDNKACGQLMTDILSKNSDFVNFGVIQMNGDVTCSAINMVRSVNLADREHFRRAAAERRFISGNYVFGRVLQKHTINLTYPVIRGSDVVAVLFAAIDLSQLDKFVADIQLPEGSLMWTADARGTVISRRPDAVRLAWQAGATGLVGAGGKNGPARRCCSTAMAPNVSTPLPAWAGPCCPTTP